MLVCLERRDQMRTTVTSNSAPSKKLQPAVDSHCNTPCERCFVHYEECTTYRVAEGLVQAVCLPPIHLVLIEVDSDVSM